jgi:formylmethanofuran dehydrogenase subunit B
MASERTLRRDVVCPFCGLACDDLVIEQEGERLRVKEGACGRSRDLFERPPADAAPQIAGKPVALEAAIARAAELLRDSRLPLFAGLATDVDGMRAVMQLADRIGGAVDHAASEALLRNLSVLRDTGWVTITLSEVRNRMDLLVVFGHPPDEAFPRFTERCVRPPRTLFSDEPPLRQVIRIGPPAAAADPSALELPCAIEQLPEVAAALKSLVAGHPLPGTEVAGLPAERLQEVAECLRTARYGVVAWAAAEFDFAAAGRSAR